MISKFLSGLFSVITGFISLLLTPIDAFIENVFPDFNAGLNALGSLVSWLSRFLAYAVDLSGIPTDVIALVVGFWLFAIGSTMAFYVVKLVLRWYRILMP